MARWLCSFVLVFFAACASSGPRVEPPAAPSASEAAPPRVIFFVGDGAGTPYWSAARYAVGDLAADDMPVVGLVDTRSASSKITDSAAGATAYATGVRTYNGAIAVGPDSVPLRTVLEAAEAEGMATGLVATSSITHATPASFAAHVVDRGMEFEIARQIAEKQIEVLLGGGRGFFDGSDGDARNLLPELRRRYTFVDDADEFRALDTDTVGLLLGLFAEEGMPPAADREISLAAMTSAALEILGDDPQGFFLVVEGSQPDWRGHANAPLDAVTAEMLDLDRAIAEALAYRARHPETLVVVTADHETGGLALETDSTGALVADYTTHHHTAEMVPLFAAGPGAERFGGILPNTRVGELLWRATVGTAPTGRITAAHQAATAGS